MPTRYSGRGSVARTARSFSSTVRRKSLVSSLAKLLGVSPVRSMRCGLNSSRGAVSGKPPTCASCADSVVPLKSAAWSAATVSAQKGRASAFAATRLRVR